MSDKSKICYVSDYHFYHNLALMRSRSDKFKSVDEMNEEMIKRHNEKVIENDHVYILGDIIVCEEELDLKYFESACDSEIIRDNNKNVQLYHYPLLTWHKKQKGAYHVHGHLHNERKCSEFKILCSMEKELSACVEINNYEPCTLEELIKNNTKFKNTMKES